MWDGSKPSREVFMTVLANIDAILIRATYHTVMTRATLRDVSIEIAVPEPTGQRTAPMVEKCDCPEGYAGLSCQVKRTISTFVYNIERWIKREDNYA